MIDEADRDQDGKISPDEFLRVMRKRASGIALWVCFAEVAAVQGTTTTLMMTEDTRPCLSTVFETLRLLGLFVAPV